MHAPSTRQSPSERLVHEGKMRAASRFVAEVLDAVADKVKPGITTDELDSFCRDMIEERGGKSGALGYVNFPKSICVSVNNVIAHGIPGNRVLQDGDVVKVDVCAKLGGVFGDSCRTYFAGEPSPRAKTVALAAHDAMMAGINAVRPGNTINDIGAAIEHSIDGTGCCVMPSFGSHGIGERLHMNPRINPYAEKGESPVLTPGMTFTIEPLVMEGASEDFVRSVSGEVIACGNKLGAQFEHTLLVTDTGCEILTASPKGIYLPESIRHTAAAHTSGGLQR